jgi:hypothetical protein
MASSVLTSPGDGELVTAKAVAQLGNDPRCFTLPKIMICRNN